MERSEVYEMGHERGRGGHWHPARPSEPTGGGPRHQPSATTGARALMDDSDRVLGDSQRLGAPSVILLCAH